jgi:hypothetical protein
MPFILKLPLSLHSAMLPSFAITVNQEPVDFITMPSKIDILSLEKNRTSEF